MGYLFHRVQRHTHTHDSKSIIPFRMSFHCSAQTLQWQQQSHTIITTQKASETKLQKQSWPWHLKQAHTIVLQCSLLPSLRCGDSFGVLHVVYCAVDGGEQFWERCMFCMWNVWIGFFCTFYMECSISRLLLSLLWQHFALVAPANKTSMSWEERSERKTNAQNTAGSGIISRCCLKYPRQQVKHLISENIQFLPKMVRIVIFIAVAGYHETRPKHKLSYTLIASR